MMQASPTQIFSYPRIARALKRHRAHHADHDIFWQQACAQIAERLGEMQRHFPELLCLAPYDDGLKNALTATGKADHIRTLSWYDTLPGDMHAAPEHIPLDDHSIDAVVCAISLSTINDVPGVFAQLQRALKPDGLLLVSVLGGSTLNELREVLAEAETALSGGISPHIHPFVDVRDAGALLQRTGFQLPVIDRDVITVTYPDMFALMHELRAIGAGNMLQQMRSNFTGRQLFLEAAKRYAERFGNDDGSINATLEMITLTGWKAHESQPKPLAPGSAKHSLAAALKQ